MMAASRKMLDHEPDEVEMLLPWHAAGTLNARDARRVEEALVRDSQLAKEYAAIQEEYAETIHLNESLGAPSAHALQKLFVAIDAEPVRKPPLSSRIAARASKFFARLSPRTLAWSTVLGGLVVLLQAGVISAVLMKGSSFETASLTATEQGAPVTRDLGGASPPRALVRFRPDARIADITTLLEHYQASILGGAREGMFRLQFGNSAMGRDEVASLMSKLQKEEIVSLAVETS